jgi:hypothetical protein
MERETKERPGGQKKGLRDDETHRETSEGRIDGQTDRETPDGRRDGQAAGDTDRRKEREGGIPRRTERRRLPEGRELSWNLFLFINQTINIKKRRENRACFVGAE